MLGIATAYARLNRSEPNCGNGYVWVGKSLGPWPGFLTGWVTVVGIRHLLRLHQRDHGLGRCLIFANKAGLHSLAGIALDPTSTAVSHRRRPGDPPRPSPSWPSPACGRATRLQFALLVFEYAVLLVFCGWALVTGGHAVLAVWFNPFEISSGTPSPRAWSSRCSSSGAGTRPSASPRRRRAPSDAARGGFIALFAMLGLFLFASVAFQREMSLAELVRTAPRRCRTSATELAAEPLGHACPWSR